MPTDYSFEWLYQQIRALNKRLERVEGKCEQLRSEGNAFTLGHPTRREFDELKARVAEIEDAGTPNKRRSA